MKVSQNWLKELVDINSTPDVLADKLSIGGFEVESLKDTSLQVNGVLLGKVLSVNKHPNSTKLHVCKVLIETCLMFNFFVLAIFLFSKLSSQQKFIIFFFVKYFAREIPETPIPSKKILLFFRFII